MFWKKNNNNTSNETENIDYTQKVETLKEQFITELDTIKSVSKSDISNWVGYLNSIGVTPVGEEQRAEAKTKGLTIPKTAFPSEYRAALVVLKKKTKNTVVMLHRDIKAADELSAEFELEEFTDKYLKKMVKKELKRYIELSRPKVSVTDIFANASKSMNKYSPKEVGDKSYSIKCKTCGAARLEEDQYDVCFYCGTPLFKK